MARRLLLQLAHPLLERSRANRQLLEAVRDLPGVTLNDLYEEYPDQHLDVAREQALLVEHDVIVFQHPFYWYSVPPLLKTWQDLVLEHGWAYGATGKRLVGKLTFNAVTTGGPAQAYQKDGANRFTMRELLSPWDQTAHLCGMRFLAPFVVHSSLVAADETDFGPYATRYRQLFIALRDETLDLDAATTAQALEPTLVAELQ